MGATEGTRGSSGPPCKDAIDLTTLLRQHEERLAFFDAIFGKLRRVADADVPDLVDRTGRDEQDLSGLERHRRLAIQSILQGAFDFVDDLFARMAVPWDHHPGRKTREHLDRLASWDAQIVPLEIGARDSRRLRLRLRLLLLRHVQRQGASDRQHRYRHNSSRLPVTSSRLQIETWLSAERERERFDAGVEKLDLELAVADGAGLPDQLIEPLFSGCSVAIGVDVSSMSGARRLAVDEHAEADGLPSIRPSHHEMKVARVKA